VPEDALEPLPAATFYHHHLIGCMVATRDGRVVGPVTAVEGESIGSRLVVRSTSGDVLIPLVDAICPEVDVAGKRITIDPPPGLLDLDGAAEVGGPSGGRRGRRGRVAGTER
jgi:16S rRNA processing protein RimM